MSVLATRLSKALALTDSLASGLSAEALQSRNGKARSNTIGGQFWCLVGARESYARAFEVGSWQGFACSLTEPHAPAAVTTALADSRTRIEAHLADAPPQLDEAREAILLDLLQHEAQHQGQLIRYFYANGLAFPAEFAAAYALD